MDHVKISADVLSVDEATSLVSCSTAGAISMFIGTTRDSFEGKRVIRLEYETYEPMAVKEMKKSVSLLGRNGLCVTSVSCIGWV